MTRTARTILRGVFAVLVVALLVAALVSGELELITAAMLAAVAGAGVDVRRVQVIAATR